MNKIILTGLCALLLTAGAVHAQSTTFTYQGRLNSTTNPATGLYDFSFNLFALSSGGVALTTSNGLVAVPVTNGLFTVALNFGNQFPGADRWLEIAVRTNGTAGYTVLAPRQPLTPVPYAIRAAAAGTAATAGTATNMVASGIIGASIATNVVDSSKITDGTITAVDLSGTLLSNTFWRLLGNANTTQGVHFLGTTDNQPLEIKVNNTRAQRIEPTAGTPNLIGGHSGNSVAPSSVGATVGGGGAAGFPNRVAATYGTVAGGLGNAVLGNDSFIGGGIGNTVQTNADRAVISGGRDNSIGTNADNSVIVGGADNAVGRDAHYALAAGRRAKVNHQGAFVWADSQNADFTTTASNQFLIRAAGGVGIGVTNPAGALQVAGTIIGTQFSGSGAGLTNVVAQGLSAGGASAFWQLHGNANTTQGVHFLGTTSNQVMEFRANNTTALRLDRNNDTAVPNLIGGFGGNFVVGGWQGAVIGGGGGAGDTNRILSGNATTISGGSGNTVAAEGGVIGGGVANTVSGQYSTVSGGQNNSASFGSAVIAGGDHNTVGNDRATVSGGYSNRATGLLSTVGGGDINLASGQAATVPGGSLNAATAAYSFAAGRRAKANHQGAFVWADSQNADFSSTTNDQLIIRAANGVGIGTTASGSSLQVKGGIRASGGSPGSGGVNNRGYAFGDGGGDNDSGMFSSGDGQLEFFGNSAERMRIASSGNIGVGTTSPSTLMDVAGTTTVRGDIIVDGDAANAGTTTPGLIFGGNNITSGEAIASRRTAGTNQYGLDFYTSYQNRLSIANNGSIGIGTPTPAGALLDIEGSARMNNNDIFLRDGTDANHGLGWYGQISGEIDKRFNGVNVDGPVLYGYAGGALATKEGGDKIALHWNSAGEVTVKVLTITGGADLAEPFPVKDEDIEPGSVMVIDDEHPGRLKLGQEPYDTRVAGIVSGAGGVQPGIALHQQGVLEGGRNVALTGRVYVKADAAGGEIRPGDLLTTSANPGHAMKVADHSRAQGAILGKAMSGLKDGQGLVLVLVTLQ